MSETLLGRALHFHSLEIVTYVVRMRHLGAGE